MNRNQLKKLEDDLWAAADKLRANSDLKASEYSSPVLGLIFLKFADNKYRQHEDAILAEYQKLKGCWTRALSSMPIKGSRHGTRTLSTRSFAAADLGT